MGPPLLAPGSLCLVGALGHRRGDRQARALSDSRTRTRHLPSAAAASPTAARAARRRRCSAATPTTTCSSRRALGRGDAAASCSTASRTCRRSASSTRREAADAEGVLRRRHRRRTPSRGSRCSPTSTRSSTRASATATSYYDMPDDGEIWRLVARGLDEEARAARLRRVRGRAARGAGRRSSTASRRAELHGGVWSDAQRRARVLGRDALLSRRRSTRIPWAWNEIGFGGPAYPRGYARVRHRRTSGETRERGRRARPSTPIRSGVTQRERCD